MSRLVFMLLMGAVFALQCTSAEELVASRKLLTYGSYGCKKVQQCKYVEKYKLEKKCETKYKEEKTCETKYKKDKQCKKVAAYKEKCYVHKTEYGHGWESMDWYGKPKHYCVKVPYYKEVCHYVEVPYEHCVLVKVPYEHCYEVKVPYQDKVCYYVEHCPPKKKHHKSRGYSYGR